MGCGVLEWPWLQMLFAGGLRWPRTPTHSSHGLCWPLHPRHQKMAADALFAWPALAASTHSSHGLRWPLYAHLVFSLAQRRWQSSASAARREARCPNCRHPRGSFCGPALRRRRSSPRSRRRSRVNGHGFLAAEELCERRSPQDRMRGSVYALRRSPEKVEAFSEYSRACSFPDSWQTL